MKKYRILVIDHEEIVGRPLQVQLEQLGYEPVGCVTDSEQAILLTGKRCPDLVLMVMVMPLESAGEKIAVANAIRAKFSLPVVFLMGFGAKDVLLRENFGDSFSYIIQPFSDGELRSVIEMALYKHQVVAKLHLSNVALKAISQGLIICGTDQCVISVNEAFLSITGYNEAEVLNRNFEFILGSGTDSEIVKEIRLSLRKARAFSGELISYRKDGSPFWNELRITAVFDEEGRLTHYIGVILDITSRKNAEEELLASEGRYRRLFDQNPQPMWVYDVKTLEFLAVNDAAITHYGYSREEFLAISIADLVPPEGLTAFEEKLAESGNLPSVGRHKLKDGTLIHVEISSNALRFFQRQARIVLAQNVTERLIAEKKNREQAMLLDKARDAIVVRDLEGRILYWNQSAERLYGWKMGDVMGRVNIQDIFRDSAEFRSAMDTVLSKGEWMGEIEQWRADNKSLLVNAHWTLVRDENGLPLSILSINTDITERKKLEQQFLRSQRMESIGTLAGGIAHDLNNVLTPIIMSIDLLKIYLTDPKGLKILGLVGSSARRGADLVNQVLLFARGLEGRRIEVEMRDLILDLIKIVEDTFPKNVRIENCLDLDLWALEVEPTQLHQVLLNLCVNARDAMPGGGKLTIRASNIHVDAHYTTMNLEAQVGQYISIEVEDTGTGMDKELVANIFDPFFTTKEVGKGTGLGLSTSMTIVKGHGGFIEVNSDPGVGSRFCVYLPTKHTAARGLELAQEPRTAGGKGQTILVVDDEEPILQITRQTLEAAGYVVLGALDGAEAVSIYIERREDIEVVLTDMMMPIMDGPTLARMLRRMDPGVRIIGASGVSNQKMKAKAMQAGVTKFIVKPYTAETLLNTLGEILTEEAAAEELEPSPTATPE